MIDERVRPAELLSKQIVAAIHEAQIITPSILVMRQVEHSAKHDELDMLEVPTLYHLIDRSTRGQCQFASHIAVAWLTNRHPNLFPKGYMVKGLGGFNPKTNRYVFKEYEWAEHVVGIVHDRLGRIWSLSPANSNKGEACIKKLYCANSLDSVTKKMEADMGGVWLPQYKVDVALEYWHHTQKDLEFNPYHVIMCEPEEERGSRAYAQALPPEIETLLLGKLQLPDPHQQYRATNRIIARFLSAD